MPEHLTPVARAPDRASAPAAGKTGLTLVTRYYRQMKRQRLYPLFIRLRLDKKRGESLHGPVQLRPVIPGALVTPADCELASDHLETRPAFYVTPLARGKLVRARIEVIQQGRMVGEIPLRMKAVRQTFTWCLFCLAILIPALTYYLTRHVNWSRTGTGNPPNANIAEAETFDDGSDASTPQKAPEGKMVRSLPENPDVFPKLPKMQGPIERAFKRVLPDAAATDAIASFVQDVYDFAYFGTDFHLTFYLGVLLLGLTAISWAMHTPLRSSRRRRLVLE
jgi:hypothetical protein